MTLLNKPLIWINPQKITFHTLPPGAEFARRMQRQNPLDRFTTAPLYAMWRRRLVFGGDWDEATQEFSSLRQWRWMADLAAHQDDYHSSQWYLAAAAALEKNRYFRHKTIYARNLQELEQVFETVFLPLLDSMHRKGYQQDLGDWPLGLIDRQGRVLKSEKGRHRFAAALATGLTRFPLQIAAVHRNWARRDRGRALYARILELARKYE